MKIQGLFLTSRAGRRIFWTLLVAAALPLLLYGAAVHKAFDEHLQAQAQRQRLQATKYVGLGLLDKLLVARSVLEAASRTGDLSGTPAPRSNPRGRVLTNLASMSIDGRLLSGSAAWLQRWPAMKRGLLTRKADSGARLFLGDTPATEAPVPVLIVLRDATDPQRLWLGEVDHDFLFSEIQAGGAGAGICVRDAQGHALACPDTSGGAAKAALATTSAQWQLFLHADFGADDWVLSNSGAGQDSALASGPLARTALLGGLAALLVVALLGMGQVRRTMVPLERLIAGTRRLSRGEFAARVEHEQADEFGELAHSFNHMAERIGHQVEAMQVQSAIDHEILHGFDVARILQQVAQRLAALVPSAQVCVVEFDRAVPTLARVHRGDGSVAVLAVPHSDAARADAGPRGGLMACDASWLRQALPLSVASTFASPARIADQTLALLVLGTDGAGIDDADTLREIGELSGRVAVALTGADRERRLHERATRDGLTGLANRLALFEHVEGLMQSGSLSQAFSLMFIDLDRFKDVNDAMGHHAGDALLCALAQRVSARTNAGTLLARPGGDEFVLVLPGTRTDAQTMAETLLQELSQPVTIENRAVTVTCSIGMAHHPDDAATASDLMRRADMAMYSAKGGGGRCAWFEPAMDARVAERSALMGDLRLALERGEFELHYQPRVEVISGEIRCSEALLRWRRWGKEMVPPGRFVDLLEESGLIDTVGLWAIEAACRQIVAWRNAGLVQDSVAVNVSTRQLHAASFAQQVLDIVQRCGLVPADLELEITESIFIGNSADAIMQLRVLREAGVGIALDDFGTGYSSLSYLHTLPISCLKVDRSFVAELGERDSAMALTRSIVALANALRLQVVAEGVETTQQAQLLRELGCSKLQGFLFSKPLTPVAFIQRCSERGAADEAKTAGAVAVENV